METYNFVMCLHKLLVEKIKEKVPGKVGEGIFDNYKCYSFQGPKAGPGLRPIYAHFACSPALHGVGKIQKNNSCPPPYARAGSATATPSILKLHNHWQRTFVE